MKIKLLFSLHCRQFLKIFLQCMYVLTYAFDQFKNTTQSTLDNKIKTFPLDIEYVDTLDVTHDISRPVLFFLFEIWATRHINLVSSLSVIMRSSIKLSKSKHLWLLLAVITTYFPIVIVVKNVLCSYYTLFVLVNIKVQYLLINRFFLSYKNR